MKLEINEIYHNYITKIVIFSIFLFKNEKNPLSFENSVQSFISKRIFWDINLKLNLGPSLTKEDQRKVLLDTIIDNIEYDYLLIISIYFKTPLKEVSMDIDLSNENKYQNFLYS